MSRCSGNVGGNAGAKNFNVGSRCGVQIYGSPPNCLQAIFTHFCYFLFVAHSRKSLERDLFGSRE